jgi:hypothetical protein
VSGPAPFPFDWGHPGINDPFYALSPPDDLLLDSLGPTLTTAEIDSTFSTTSNAFNPLHAAADQSSQLFPWGGLDPADFPISALSQPPPLASLPIAGWPTAPVDDPINPELEPSLNVNVIIDLVDLFFDRVQCFVPLFHRRNLRDSVLAQGTSPSCPLLLYSIMAVAAFAHPDPDVRANRPLWYRKAKIAYEATGHMPEQPLETLQAATCLVLYAFTVGGHSDGLLILGKASRQAVALGLHHMDSPTRAMLQGMTLPGSGDWRETEQRRRVVWALFILDRGMCFLAGFAYAIDDRQLRVRLPLEEAIFQDSDEVRFHEIPSSWGSAHHSQQPQDTAMYSQDPKALLASLHRDTANNPLHYLILSYSLLGRISEHMYSPEYDEQDAPQRSERETLEQTLTKMRLVLPRSATDLAAASSSDFRYAVWLRISMDVHTIFLHHTPKKSLQHHDRDECHQDNWSRCVATARNTALLIREASRVSVDLLMNPLLAAPIFVCARILVIEYVLTSHPPPDPPRRDSALRADLEAMVLALDRLKEAFNGVEKFRVGLFFHLRHDPAALLAIKSEGSRGILRTCSKWTCFSDLDVLSAIPD